MRMYCESILIMKFSSFLFGFLREMETRKRCVGECVCETYYPFGDDSEEFLMFRQFLKYYE